MKIIILNGSPRKNGNTARLTAAFTKGAEQTGNTVIEFMLDSMNISGCKGCFGGGRDKDSPCVQKDDMDKIYPAYREADVVVMASPLYFWTISGQLRCAFDRLFAAMEGEAGDTSPKSGVLLMAAEGSEFEESVYYYDRLMDHMHWKNLGKVLCGGVYGIGDIEGKPELAEAEKLGASIG